MFRGLAKPRNGPTLRAAHLGNLPFNFEAMTKRSIASHFTAPCLKWTTLAGLCST